MSRIVLSSEIEALEASVRGARIALACPFSSSDEYEAAIIQERREAGLYGTGFSAWSWGCALVVLLVVFFYIA